MRRIIYIGLLWLMFSIKVQAEPAIDWSDYDFGAIEEELEELESGTQYYDQGPQFDSFLDLMGKLLDGSVELSFTEVVRQILNLVLGEIREQWRLMLELAALLILSGLLKNLSSSFGSAQVEQIAFYVLFAAAVTLLFHSFLTAYQIAQETGSNITSVLLSLLPVLAAVKAAAGAQVTAVVQSGFLISAVNFGSWLVQTVFFSGILVFIVFSAVNQLTGQNMMKKLMAFAKTLIQKGIKAVSAVFLFLVGLQGIVAPAADTLVKKTMISAAGAVPVVGKAIGGAVDTIFAGASLVGSCVGSAGMIILLCVCMIPIAKLLALWFLYKATSAVLSPIAESKLTDLMDAMADGVGMMIGVLFVLIGMFVCGIGIFLRSL